MYGFVTNYDVKETDFSVVTEDDKKLNYMLNTTIKKITDDVSGRFSFNTAISSIMELVNELYRYKQHAEINEPLFCAAVTRLVVILSPFTPHICEEMWSALGHTESLTEVGWPAYDESALEQDTIEIIVQINGKLKEKMQIASGLDRAALEEQVRANEKVQALIEGKNVVKTIAVPDKLVNFVVR